MGNIMANDEDTNRLSENNDILVFRSQSDIKVVVITYQIPQSL